MVNISKASQTSKASKASKVSKALRLSKTSKAKKGQVQEQIFIYILSLLIIGLLLYFGIKWVGGIIWEGDKIDTIKIGVEFEKTFADYRTSYGSWGEEDLRVPSGIERVCFVEKNSGMFTPDGTPMAGLFDSRGLCQPEHVDYDPLMCNAWKTQNDQNILFDPMEKVESGINIGDLEIAGDGYVCFKVYNRNIRVMLTGTGKKVRVSVPPEESS